MKKIIFDVVIIGFLVSIASLILYPVQKNVVHEKPGCCHMIQTTNEVEFTKHSSTVSTAMVLIEGHKYIIASVFHGGSIIHSESCDCKKNQYNSIDEGKLR